MVAHRGYSSVTAENTIAALKAAASRGVIVIETDIMMTLDGVPICAHDYSLGPPLLLSCGDCTLIPS